MTLPVTTTIWKWRHSQTWQRSVTHSHKKYYVRYIAGGILFYVGEGLHIFLRENEQQCFSGVYLHPAGVTSRTWCTACPFPCSPLLYSTWNETAHRHHRSDIRRRSYTSAQRTSGLRRHRYSLHWAHTPSLLCQDAYFDSDTAYHLTHTLLSAPLSRHHSASFKVHHVPCNIRILSQVSLFWKFSFDTQYLRQWCYLFFAIFCTIYWNITCNSPQWARASSITRFLDHTQRRTTVRRIPLDEW
jgi:hypothetical protein